MDLSDNIITLKKPGLTKESAERIAKKIERMKSDNSKELNEKAKFLECDSEQSARIEVIRSSFSKMYDVIDINCKSSREISLAIEKLEEAQFWAIKGISREVK